MTVKQTICDECQRVKGESNHWQKIGIINKSTDNSVSLHLGYLFDSYDEIHDLCGESCFHKHIAKLLKFDRPETAAVLPA